MFVYIDNRIVTPGLWSRVLVGYNGYSLEAVCAHAYAGCGYKPRIAMKRNTRFKEKYMSRMGIWRDR
jgi:hypothetical protein